MKLPSYNKKEEEEKKEQEQTSYKPLPRGVGRKQTETLPAPEVSTPTFQSSVLNLFGLGDTPLDASQGRTLMQTGQELMTEPEINDWAGRNEMIGEYRGLQTAQNMGATDAALPSSILARQAEQSDRMHELRNQLEQGDIAAGNGPMSYSAQDRTGSVLAGTGMNIASGLASAAGTAGEAVARGQMIEQAGNMDQAMLDARFGEDTTQKVQEAISAAEADRGRWQKITDAADRLGESATAELNKAKNGLSKLGQVGVDISENMIEMGFDMAVGAATGGSSLIPMFARTFGSAASEARKDGASLDEQILYGTTKAGIEVLTEKMFDGLAGVYGKGAADEITEKLIGKLAKSKEGATMLRVLFSGGGEMIEEFVSSLLDPLAKSTYQKITAPNLAGFGVTEALSAEDARALTEEMSKPGYFSNVDVSDMLYSGLVGFLIGALGGGASIATGQNARANAELGFGTEAAVEAAPEVTAPETPVAPTVEAAPEVTTPEVAPTQPVTQTVVNRSQANKIINDPARRAAFEAESGLALPGRKSEAAQMVMDYYAQQAQNIADNTTPGVDFETNPQYDSTIGGEPSGSEGTGSEGEAVPDVRSPVPEYDRGDAFGGQELPGNSTDVRGLRALSDAQRQTLTDRGIAFFDTNDVSENKAAFSNALEEGKASQKYGPFVDSKPVEALTNARTYMAPDGAGGFAIRDDGDIEAVFTRRGVAPPKSSAGLVIGAVAQGGTKLDCYGQVLVNNYASGGFIPVAQVDWNQDYAPPGWTPELGTPQVYVMMHNGDSADTVAANFGNYHYYTQAELDALPRFTGDSGYDNALAYRDMLLDRQQAQQNTQAQPAPEVNTTEAGISMPVEAAPVEPGVTMPTTENGPVSQTAGTVRNSPQTNETTAAAIDEATEAGGFNYLPISNNETANQARAQIDRDGFEASLAKWEKEITQGKTSASLIVTGRLLFNDAQAQGNTEMAIQILSDLQAATTNTAQALQIQRMFASMDPVTRYSALQRQIDKLSDKYSRQLPDGVQISDELKAEYINAASEEARNEALDKIRDSIAQQLPSTWRDKVRALRYLNMLGNFRTQGRNLIGNTAMGIVTSAKNAVKWGLERLTGAKRTTSLVANRALVDAGMRDYEAHADLINGESKYSDRAETGLAREAEEQKQVFKSKILEGYRKATNWAMTRGDTLFIGRRYARTFAGYLQANGMDAQTLNGIQDGTITPTKEQSKLIEDARNYAAKEAQEATFHDNNVLSDWVSRLGRKETTPKAAQILAEGVMPFRKTPANVLVRAEEYSPLGLINTAYKAAQAAKGNSEVTSSDVINQLSKSLTGTGLFILGMALRNSGHLTGHEEDDKQREFNSLRGDQEYALVLPDGTSFTLDWVAPASMPLFMGAQMMDIVADGDVSLDDLSDVFTSLADPMIEMSMLQGLNDALDNLKYSDNNLGTIAANAALSYLTQIMSNTMLGQAERTFEDRRYSTFVNSGSKTGKMVERAIGKLSAKTPGWDRNQVEYVDAWGRTQDTGTPLARAATNFLSPGYVGRDRSTEVDDELQRLYDAGQNNVFPQRIGMSEKVSTYDSNGQKTGERNLTADEYVQFQKVMGQTSLELVKDLMNSRVYGNLTDEARAAAISDIYSYAKNLAAQKVEPSTKKEYSDVAKLSNVAAYYGIKQAISKATSNKFDRDYSALDTLMKDYSSMPADVRKLLEEKNSNVAKVHEAYQAGIKTRDYYKLTDGISNLKPAEGYANPANWQKIELISQSKLSEDQMDVMMHQYFSDGADKRYDESRAAGYTPSQLAAWYRINSLNSKKAQKLAAATEYGFTKKQAAQLYKLWN